MSAGYQKMYRLVTAAIIYCLLSVCILNTVPGGSVLAQTPASQTSSQILEITGGNYILLNNNRVPEGTTVPTGAQIQTEGAKRALIRFERLGSLEIGCRSSLTLAYTNDQVEVTVLSGYAQLTTNQGVSGTIILPGGRTVKTDSSLPTSTVETLDKNPCAAVPPGAVATGGGAAAGGLFGLGTLTTILLGGAVGLTVAGFIIAGETDPVCGPPQAVSPVFPPC